MFEQIETSIAEIQQSRSRFQLEKFVIGQHPTKEMQFFQLCIELQDLIYKYKYSKISLQKQELKIKRLRATKDELDELEAQEIEIGMEQTRLAVIGAERELGHLFEIYNGLEKKYTRSEIEQAQPDYWRDRLTNNARAMLMGGVSVSPAHIESMQQAGVLDAFVAEVQKSKGELQ
jgi:hypothetical protein